MWHCILINIFIKILKQGWKVVISLVLEKNELKDITGDLFSQCCCSGWNPEKKKKKKRILTLQPRVWERHYICPETVFLVKQGRMTCEMSGKPHRLLSTELSAHLFSPGFLLRQSASAIPACPGSFAGDDTDRNGGETRECCIFNLPNVGVVEFFLTTNSTYRSALWEIPLPWSHVVQEHIERSAGLKTSQLKIIPH